MEGCGPSTRARRARSRARAAAPRVPVETRRDRELWKTHSIAEDPRPSRADLDLTEGLRYELIRAARAGRGTRARRASTPSCSRAFPDIHFDLTDIVFGPQGVSEEARVPGTFDGADRLDNQATGEFLQWRVVIFFPWDPDKRKFKGEKVYTEGAVFNQRAMR